MKGTEACEQAFPKARPSQTGKPKKAVAPAEAKTAVDGAMTFNLEAQKETLRKEVKNRSITYLGGGYTYLAALLLPHVERLRHPAPQTVVEWLLQHKDLEQLVCAVAELNSLRRLISEADCKMGNLAGGPEESQQTPTTTSAAAAPSKAATSMASASSARGCAEIAEALRTAKSKSRGLQVKPKAFDVVDLTGKPCKSFCVEEAGIGFGLML